MSLFQQPVAVADGLARSESVYKIDLTEKALFGVDDSAHEDFELLRSYSLERRDCSEFFDTKIPFMAICAPKGTGKTTMCRLLEHEIATMYGHVAVLKYDSQISPSLSNGASLADWIRAWKKEISETVLTALAGTEKITLDPDMISVVERAEKRGKRRQNLIGLLLEHFSLPNVRDTNSLPTDKDQFEILKRISAKSAQKVWLFLDEIDQYFAKDDVSIKKVSSLLLACRELTSYVDGLFIRVTIKPNVYAIVENEVDSVANMRELVIPIEWTDDLIRSMLARRVESYLERNGVQRFDEGLLHGESASETEEWLISQIFFTERFDLGKGNRPPHVILSNLGNRRPRWVLDLCKLSAKMAIKTKSSLIQFEHVKETLWNFGNRRITDLCSEYKSQCPDLSKLINRFHGAPTQFNGFKELVSHIQTVVLSKLKVEISGVSKAATAREAADFLHMIGFIDARKDISRRQTVHVSYSERPGLVEAQAMNEQDDYYWEVHPAFRDALSLGRAPNKKIWHRSNHK